MATVLKGERRGRGGKLSSSGGAYTYTVRRDYIVLSDVKDEQELTVLTTAGLPQVRLSVLPGTNNECICSSLDPKQDEKNPYVWIVSAEFSTSTDKQDTTGGNPDPETWIPLYSGKMEFYPEVVYFDRSTPPKPYVNSANDKFPEPLIYKRPVIVYDFWQIEPDTITDPQLGDRNDTINQVGFKGFAAQTLKLNVKAFDRGLYYGARRLKVYYECAYKKTKWLNTPLNVGYSYLDSSGKKIASDFLVALNSDGTKKADNAVPDKLEFKEFPEIAFAGFLR